MNSLGFMKLAEFTEQSRSTENSLNLQKREIVLRNIKKKAAPTTSF